MIALAVLGLLAGWLVAALVVLWLDGLLPAFLAWAVPGSLVLLGSAALVRWHRRPSLYCLPSTPPLPPRYRAADDLRRPLAEVVAIAELEATAGR